MPELRSFQRETLAALERPGHVICVAPTGSGKSLIYERFAARPGRRTLLVTPLVALARQQAARLEAAGLRVRAGASRAGDGTAAWIASPETLAHPSSARFLSRWRPDLLVVDECHCVWEWGERFRPAFAAVPELLRAHRVARSLWLTATLPREARLALRATLSPVPVEIGSFALPDSLTLEVRRVPWSHRVEALHGWISAQEGPGLVFAPTRETTERLARLLEAGLARRVRAYHAGLGQEERRALESEVRENRVDVTVATSAFGMGMDFAHLRWVALWQAPLSLLALAQAIGRVGRNAAGGRALVLWDDEDFRLLEWAAQGSERSREELVRTLAFLQKGGCPRKALAQYFDAEGPDC
jgi:ATP-dependent DNA helicase RecQ